MPLLPRRAFMRAAEHSAAHIIHLTHETFPLMLASRYGKPEAGSMLDSSIMPEDPEDCFGREHHRK